MCNNNGNSCCWIIILLIILWACCGNGSFGLCGSNNCGCARESSCC